MKVEYLKCASSLHPNEDSSAQQLACYQLVVDTFSDDESPHLRHRVASALLAKAIGYCESNETETALRAIDDLLANYSQDFLPATRAVVAAALSDKGQLLESLDLSRAVECYDAVISNYRHHPDASLRFVVAKAMGRRATLAMQEGQGGQAIELLNQIVMSYENDSSEELKALVVLARELLTTINRGAMAGDSAN